MAGNHWEPIDVDDSSYCGVFYREGYSPEPLAIFPSEASARAWIALQSKEGIDPTLLDVMEIPDLAGHIWNNVEPAPNETPVCKMLEHCHPCRTAERQSRRVAAEREAIAKIVETSPAVTLRKDLAAAIRARGGS